MTVTTGNGRSMDDGDASGRTRTNGNAEANVSETQQGAGAVPGHEDHSVDPAWSEAVRTAAMRPMLARPSAAWKATVAVLSLVVLAGFVAWGYQLKHGLGSAGYNNQAFWAVYIVDVITFIGVSYGGAVISAILRLTGQSWRAPLTRLAEGMALVTVLIGGAFIFPHLGRPERFLNIVAYPNMSSPLVWDFLAIATYSVATMIFFYLPLIPDLAVVQRTLGSAEGGLRHAAYRFLSFGWLGTARQRRLLHGALGVVALLIVPLAVSVHSVLSWAFAVTSRPGWSETVFPPYFVVAALYSGTALVIVTAAAFRKGYRLQRFITRRHFVRLGYLMAALGLVYAYLTFADLLTDGYTGITSGWVRQTVTGAYAPAFWFYVVAGEILPIVLVAMKRTRTVGGMTVASVGVVISLWIKRLVIVLPPVTQPLVAGKWGSYHFTWVSITITLAGVAAIPLLLMLLFRFVPVLSIDEMEEAGPIGSFEQVSTETEKALAEGTIGTEVREPVGALAATDVRASTRRHTRWPLRRPRGATLALVVAAVALGAAAVVGIGADAKPAGAATLAQAAPAPAPAQVATAATPAGAPAATPVTLAVAPVAAGKATLALRATVGTTAAPGTGDAVTFSVVSHEFAGSGLMQVGTATTDAAGIAQVDYVPTWTGQEQFVARVVGPGGSVAASATTTYTVTVDPPGLPKSIYEYQRPLTTTGHWVVVTLLTIVAIIWVLLLGSLTLVVVRMPRLGRR
ncbi:MAG: polysulfide reductase NrfD [Actinomycetota bacterium]|jgi:molybdopterin-containing oxidoreductase family membrane subunit|nr:polysulfide reductase NrfD [Actinomycetota bacterium]